jgi:chemotaxis protein MotB
LIGKADQAAAAEKAREDCRRELASVTANLMELKTTLALREGTVDDLSKKVDHLEQARTQAEKQLHELSNASRSMEDTLTKQISNQEIKIETYREMITVSFVDRILFKFGQAGLTPTGKKALADVVEALKGITDKRIKVVGHTDDIPIKWPDVKRFPSNWEMSSARAAAVVRFLIDEGGIDPAKIEAVGRSHFDPLVPNDSDANRARNRRVEIIITPDWEKAGQVISPD